MELVIIIKKHIPTHEFQGDNLYPQNFVNTLLKKSFLKMRKFEILNWIV